MGAFDSLASIFLLFGGVHTSGSTQALLGNAVIPVTMILSYFILKSRYKHLQYVGALIIMIGVFVVLLPTFISPATSNQDDEPIFNIIFLMYVIPQGMSSVYKEVAFKDADIDVNYLQAWVALWQGIFVIFLIPLNTLKFLGDNYMSWSQLPDALVNGVKCLGGANSVVDNCWVDVKVSGSPQCDACHNAYVFVILYLIFNLSYNVFIVLVIKHGGAALMYIVMTLRLPLVQIAFSLSFINDPPDSFQWYSILGLFLILGGLITYRYSTAAQIGLQEGEQLETVPTSSPSSPGTIN